MISADFYPTQYSQVSGQIELTDSFNNIQDYDGASAYWLGYINRDNVPQFRKLTDFKKEFDETTGRLKSASFNPIDTENLDFTYGAWGFVNASKCFSNPQGEILSMYSSFTPWGYINKCKVGLVRMRTPNFNFMLMVRTGSDGQNWGAPERISVGSGFEDNDNNDNGFEAFYEFVKGERSLTKTFEFSNISIDIEINANDLNENYYIPVNGESNGVFYDGILFIYRAWFDPTWNLSTPFDDSTASVTNGCIHTVGVTDLFDEDGNVYYTGSDWYQMARNEANGPDFFYLHRDYTAGAGGNIYPTDFGPQYAGLPITTYDGLHYIGGYDFEIGFDNSVWGNANHIIYTNGNIACINQYDNQLFCYTMIRPVDIRYNATLVARYEAGWLPEYDENNCPTGEFFRDSEVEEKGRPWQIDELTDNDYTEEDRPPYTPPGPGPGPINPPDEGDWGAKIPYTIFQMGESPFSHFEQLTYNGLEEFMAKLWHAPQTFWESLSATKEITANLNDYLISCRAYPIFVNGAVEHHDIYLGVGGKITLANSIYTPTIVNLCACGSITVARPYGNFLDYNPYTSASIYLPFAGQFEINPKYIYDTQLNLMLWVDLTDGSGVWVLRNSAHDYPILIKQCKVAIDIPISGQDAAQKSSNIINATLNTAQHTLTSVNRITGMANQIGLAVASGGIPASGAINLGTEAAGLALTGLSDSVNMAMANKELPYYTTGSAGAAAAEACSEPYITLRTPLCDNPTNFAHTIGNLYNKTAAISSLSGFTTCRNVDVSGINQATDKEKAQIKQILESGFYA